tara:strand:+ start:81 stop:509 length:429 start_codon:yes stop_codon:yes gene_type:complete
MAVGKLAAMGLSKMMLAGAATQAAGSVAQTVGERKKADMEGDIIEQNSQNELNALGKQQRAEFGSMLVQGAGSGVSGTSFQDIFNNQTIEDATQITQVKQATENRLAALGNKKKSALVGGVMSLGSQTLSLGAKMKENRDNN